MVANAVFKVYVIVCQAIFNVPADKLTTKSAKNKFEFCFAVAAVDSPHKHVGVFGINSFGNFAELRYIVAKINQGARFALHLF